MDSNFQDLKSAWARFVDNGHVDHAVLRQTVAESWKRCRERGLDPRSAINPVRLSPKSLHSRREQNRQYVDAALPVMRFLEKAVGDSGFALVLTDCQGIILDVFGEESAIRRAARAGYVAGSDWSEAKAGTNAIAQALIHQAPTQMTGPEHYNVNFHSWTCASVPVKSPDGQLAGTVTLAGESISGHRHTLGMVLVAGEAIETKLRERATSDEKARLNSLIGSILQNTAEPMVTLDGGGRITHLNCQAGRLLDVLKDRWLGLTIDQLFPSLRDSVPALLEGSLTAPIEVARDSKAERSYFMAKPVAISPESGNEPDLEDNKGVILILSERRAFLNKVRNISGFNARYTFKSIIGSSAALLEQVELARMAAKQNVRVLITGETGTGKELFAQAIHNASDRANGPFVAINCAALPRDLIESEIMGYVSGAFTGARKGGQVGKLELADGGTLFLDEISQMPLDLQAKLLRVLQESTITRLGDTKAVKVDVRIVAATNENLFEKCQDGEFRQDLYFRLDVVSVAIPPLRERKDDLPDLIDHILKRISQRIASRRDYRVEKAAMARMVAYDWPGNVRELENVLERAAIVCSDGLITATGLPLRISGKTDRAVTSSNGRSQRPYHSGNADMPLKDIEEDVLRTALQDLEGNIALVARRLGISRSTIYRRMREFGIHRSVSVE